MDKFDTIVIAALFLNVGACEDPREAASRMATEAIARDLNAGMVTDTSTPAPPPIEEQVTADETPNPPQLSDSGSIPASIAAPSQRHSLVLDAPGFWADMFDPSSPGIHGARARFNRSHPEERLINTRWPRAMSRDDKKLYDAVLLTFSRICVSEANWIHRTCNGVPGEICDANDDANHAELDGPGIYRVLRFTRFRGETLMGVMRRHVHVVTEERPPYKPRLEWITELNLEGTRPAHFPAHLNWTRDYRPRWLETIALAKDLLAGHKRGPCADAPIIAWGGRCDDGHGACDDHIAEARGLVPYEYCGSETRQTRNRFWCRPGVAGCPVPDGPEAVMVIDPI